MTDEFDGIFEKEERPDFELLLENAPPELANYAKAIKCMIDDLTAVQQSRIVSVPTVQSFKPEYQLKIYDWHGTDGQRLKLAQEIQDMLNLGWRMEMPFRITDTKSLFIFCRLSVLPIDEPQIPNAH
jgi:hypothetical protein